MSVPNIFRKRAVSKSPVGSWLNTVSIMAVHSRSTPAHVFEAKETNPTCEEIRHAQAFPPT